MQTLTFWRKVWKPLLILFAVGSMLLLIGAAGRVVRDLSDAGPTLVYYTTSRTDLPLVVTERGSLESQIKTTIECQVESVSYSRNSVSGGTQIIYIVPNGTQVAEGDLLVELDSAAIRDRLEQEILDYQSGRSERIQADARYKNQLTQNKTAKAQAELAIELAKLTLEMYQDPDSGTFKLAVENIERLIDDTRNDILAAQAAMELEKDRKAGVEELFRLGYKSKSSLDQSRYDFMKAEAALVAAVSKLSNHEAARRQLGNYERKMELLRLEGEVATSERHLEQVLTSNESALAEAEAERFETQEREQREKSRVEQYRKQLEYCKIYAPHAGMVVYAQNSRDPSNSAIGEGALVRQRQEILSLPDLSRMQIRTQIHEAVLEQISPGLPVTVRVDAFPNRKYDGIVSDVGVVPARSYGSTARTYDCVVRILGEVEQLRPGMTAVCEIHVDRIRDVVSVPVQAIVQVDAETWCYVDDGTGIGQRAVDLGRSNDHFVHIVRGIGPGERVILNPSAIFTEEEAQKNELSPDSGTPEAPIISPEELAREEARASPRASRSGSESIRSEPESVQAGR